MHNAMKMTIVSAIVAVLIVALVSYVPMRDQVGEPETEPVPEWESGVLTANGSTPLIYMSMHGHFLNGDWKYSFSYSINNMTLITEKMEQRNVTKLRIFVGVYNESDDAGIVSPVNDESFFLPGSMYDIEDAIWGQPLREECCLDTKATHVYLETSLHAPTDISSSDANSFQIQGDYYDTFLNVTYRDCVGLNQPRGLND